MNSYKFHLLLKLIANKRMNKETHSDPDEEVSQNLVDYPVMPGELVNGRKLRVDIDL